MPAPPYHLAHLHEIPGSRCGPEDGPWPRPYQLLDNVDIWRELSALAKPQSWRFGAPRFAKKVDTLNFQPCPRTRTQDRYVVQQLDVHGKVWSLTGVFDGHLGDSTVEHVAQRLPVVIREHLRQAFAKKPSRRVSPKFVADLISRSIQRVDDDISKDVLDLFPGGLDNLCEFSDTHIRCVLNDRHVGGRNYDKARLCMYGTTALVALVDPEHENLWIANVGDCQATLVSSDSTNKWTVEILTTPHNADNDTEVDRIRREHPGEPECVVNGRVLGALAPTRCLGDVAFKQPPEFTRRILYNLAPGFANTAPWEEFLVRNHTAPYISATPDVTHRRLRAASSDNNAPRYLILHSDGFTDLVEDQEPQRVISSWARHMHADDGVRMHHGSDNMALRLLRHALGGENEMAVSAVLTLDMDAQWIDDTTIVVQQL